MKNNISVILLCTLPDAGIKSLGSKCLISVNKKNIIQHQIDIINSVCSNHEIIISLCFDSNRVYKNIKNKYKNIKIIKNQEFDNINFGGAFIKALDYVKYDNILVINYGCVYTANTIKKILNNPSNNNIVGVIESKHSENINIGCYIDENQIINIFFNLGNIKYCDMFYVNNNTKKAIQNKFNQDYTNNKFTFELINSIIEDGHKFKPVFLSDKDYIFLNNLQTLNRCKRILINESSKTAR
jgi:choline kinase